MPKSKVDPARSAQMALVRGRDTKPEIRVRRALYAAGLRFRLHAKELPGKPDIVFRRQRVVVFVHGCFWHQHPAKRCKLARMPKSRQDFWGPKLYGNRQRDSQIKGHLRRRGWKVLEIWECETGPRKLVSATRRILRKVTVTSNS